jgi:hypothetical protein
MMRRYGCRNGYRCCCCDDSPRCMHVVLLHSLVWWRCCVPVSQDLPLSYRFMYVPATGSAVLLDAEQATPFLSGFQLPSGVLGMRVSARDVFGALASSDVGSDRATPTLVSVAALVIPPSNIIEFINDKRSTVIDVANSRGQQSTVVSTVGLLSQARSWLQRSPLLLVGRARGACVHLLFSVSFFRSSPCCASLYRC